MLPGFRFLFAAIVLSMSVLVFGLGAAAVLRAAHEQFAESGSWRPAPDTAAAQQGESARPVLAILRIDQPPTAPKPEAVLPPEQPGVAVPTPDAETPAALPSQAASPVETVTADPPEFPGAGAAPDPKMDGETQPRGLAALPAVPEPAHQDTPAAPPAEAVDIPAATDAKSATAGLATSAAPAPAASPIVSPPLLEQPLAVSTSEAFPAAPEHPVTPAAASPAASRIATLGGPPVVIDEPAPLRAVPAGPVAAELKKERDRERAEEQARRRRLAARRAKSAAQAAQAQLAANPFGQANQTVQYVQPAQSTARTR